MMSCFCEIEQNCAKHAEKKTKKVEYHGTEQRNKRNTCTALEHVQKHKNNLNEKKMQTKHHQAL